jgi:alkylated DNA repair dioxygenase AlkB
VLAGQLNLLGGGAPRIDDAFARLERRALNQGAWVDYQPGWISGHNEIFTSLVSTTQWHETAREMYDRTVDVPRLIAALPADGPGHPLIETMRAALNRHYGQIFERTGLAFYRDGKDSVAWHGDYIARDLPEAVVATVSFGEPRRFLLREKGGGTSIAYQLGWGDLIVMGGTCQRTYQHAIPKVAKGGQRLVVMFRPVWPAPPGAYRPPGY